MLERALKCAGVAHIKPNEMGRHFCATMAVLGGANIYDVKKALGHSEIKTTERYAKLGPMPIARLIGGR